MAQLFVRNLDIRDARAAMGRIPAAGMLGEMEYIGRIKPSGEKVTKSNQVSSKTA